MTHIARLHGSYKLIMKFLHVQMSMYLLASITTGVCLINSRKDTSIKSSMKCGGFIATCTEN